MISGSSYFAVTMSNGIQVDAFKATCINPACLHDVLITEIPYDISAYNTDKDYTSFTVNNEVQFDYMTKTVDNLDNLINSP